MEPIAPPAAIAAPRASTVHLTHVEGLRALAAFVVYINHAYAQVWNAHAGQFPPILLSPFTYSLVAGHLSVTVFIVVSGFCLTLPVVRAAGQLKGGALDFFRRRARRILPPYYGAVALCLLLIWTVIGKPTGSLWDVPIRVTPASIVSHLALMQDFYGTSSINYVFWSIAVEWQIYFLFPLLVWLWKRRGPTFTVALAIAVGYAIRIACSGTRIERAAPHFIGLFGLGMLAAYMARSSDAIYARWRERLPWGWISAGAALGVAALTFTWGWALSVDRFEALDFPMAVSAMSLLVLTSRPEPHRLTRWLSFRPLAFAGTISYSIYLIHAPFLQILWLYVLVPLHVGPVGMFAALMLPGAAAILGVSYVFFRIFEEPFIRKARAKTAVGAEAKTERWPVAGQAAAGEERT